MKGEKEVSSRRITLHSAAMYWPWKKQDGHGPKIPTRRYEKDEHREGLYGPNHLINLPSLSGLPILLTLLLDSEGSQKPRKVGL